jgi:hypothetical protein
MQCCLAFTSPMSTGAWVAVAPPQLQEHLQQRSAQVAAVVTAVGQECRLSHRSESHGPPLGPRGILRPREAPWARATSRLLISERSAARNCGAPQRRVGALGSSYSAMHVNVGTTPARQPMSAAMGASQAGILFRSGVQIGGSQQRRDPAALVNSLCVELSEASL